MEIVDFCLVNLFSGNDPFAGISGDFTELAFRSVSFGVESRVGLGVDWVVRIFFADDDAFRD